MFSIITISETERWDAIVKSFINYDVNYLNYYAKAFQLNGDGEPFLFYFNNGDTRAVNVVMRRDIALHPKLINKVPENTCFDISTPYGYGGFWTEGRNFKAVNESFLAYCMESEYVSEFVRFHLFSGYPQYYNGLTEVNSLNVVCQLDISVEEILKRFEYKVRKNIKKAEAAGLTFEIDTTGKRLDDFLQIYYATMERNNANESFYFSREFFETLSVLEGHYTFVHVLFEGKVISTELVLYGTENCYSFLGGTSSDYFHFRPNDFLKFQIIQWAKEKGLKRFILGGGSKGDDGIFKYKRSFAPHGVCDFIIGKNIFDFKKYHFLIELRCNDESFDKNSKFFPLYRA